MKIIKINIFFFKFFFGIFARFFCFMDFFKSILNLIQGLFQKKNNPKKWKDY